MRLSLKEYCDLLEKHPHLRSYENAAAVHTVQSVVTQQHVRSPLVDFETGPKKSSGIRRQSNSRIRLRIHFVSFSRRGRFLDGDNYQAALKPVRDEICRHLGLDDGDTRLDFEYSQARSRGDESVIVRLELC